MLAPAEDSLRRGDLEQALEQLQQQVRQAPADGKVRVFLFQLLSLLGRWDRALKQLDVLAELEPQTSAMVQTYRPALHCELLRAQIFAGQRTPPLLGEPEQWMASHLQALALATQGKLAEASASRALALDAAPATSGTIDGEPFSWIADADSRLGPMLEAIVNGQYRLIPFQRLKALRIEAPADLRDLVWTPAYLTLATGGEIVALIPTRYPGTERATDNALRLARKTEWQQHDGDTFFGIGQRMLATDRSEYPLLAARAIQFDPAKADG